MINKQGFTIADIARLAEVSKSTVSRALNDSPLIGDETKEKIKSIAKEHQFRLNAPARQLSLKQSHTIGFVTNCYHKDYSVTDLFGLEIMGGIMAGLSEIGYDMLVINVNPSEIEPAFHYIKNGQVDGLILVTSMRKQHHIQALSEKGAPFIIWGTPRPNINCCSVTGDNFSGGKLAACHLIQSGRRKIAFLGGPPDDPEIQQRYAGFEAVLVESGIKIDPTQVIYGDYSDTSGAAAMQNLLDRTPDLEAVFVNSDLMAIAAMDVVRENGRRIPEDVAIVGYDDLSIADLSYPKLTTVRQNVPYAGKLLAKNLVQYLTSGVATHVTLPVEMIVRQSG